MNIICTIWVKLVILEKHVNFNKSAEYSIPLTEYILTLYRV